MALWFQRAGAVASVLLLLNATSQAGEWAHNLAPDVLLGERVPERSAIVVGGAKEIATCLDHDARGLAELVKRDSDAQVTFVRLCGKPHAIFIKHLPKNLSAEEWVFVVAHEAFHAAAQADQIKVPFSIFGHDDSSPELGEWRDGLFDLVQEQIDNGVNCVSLGRKDAGTEYSVRMIWRFAVEWPTEYYAFKFMKSRFAWSFERYLEFRSRIGLKDIYATGVILGEWLSERGMLPLGDDYANGLYWLDAIASCNQSMAFILKDGRIARWISPEF